VNCNKNAIYIKRCTWLHSVHLQIVIDSALTVYTLYTTEITRSPYLGHFNCDSEKLAVANYMASVSLVLFMHTFMLCEVVQSKI